jgi:predicted DNA-binding protein YlxM (UPF0122 family)
MPKKLAQQSPGPLERLFNSSTARLLDFFTLYTEWDYSKTDIAENSEVSIRTVLRAIPYLEEHQIIKRTRTVGKAEMYQTNKDSPIIQHLQKTKQLIADMDVNRELEKQGCINQQTTVKQSQPMPA